MGHTDVISWLLEPENPSIRFRTQTDILGMDENSSEVKKSKTEIFSSPEVSRILNKMHPDGYWLQKNPRTKIEVGDGVEYGSFATTHFCLAYLSELGLSKEHPAVEKAANRYLNLMKEDGDWWDHMSCLLGYNIRTFIRLGYANDKRLKKAITLLLDTERMDGGYLCDMHEHRYVKKQPKSCVRGSVKALLAFSEIPEFWSHPRCDKLVSYFLSREGVFNSQKTRWVNRDMPAFSFPITWAANSWEIVLALSKMGYGNDSRLVKAWELIDSKTDNHGKYILDQSPSQSLLKAGPKGAPNKWITFYILLAKKYRDT